MWDCCLNVCQFLKMMLLRFAQILGIVKLYYNLACGADDRCNLAQGFKFTHEH